MTLRLDWNGNKYGKRTLHEKVKFAHEIGREVEDQSKGLITSLPRTSVAKLLFTPDFQPGTSKVEVWHQGFKVSSFSIV